MSPSLLPPCPYCGHEHPEWLLKCPRNDMVLPLEGRMLSEKFRLSRELGKGGMATVWLAINTLVDRPVAIKLIRPQVIRDEEVVGRFRSEAKAAGRIGHPNVCEILDFGSSPVGPYIVMEYLQGKNLGQAITREGRLEVERAVGIVRHALAGLNAAHERGIVHRDLKPENVFLHAPPGGPQTIKLMDFGVAKFTDGTAEVETGKGALLGTPEYMAPEQFAGAAHAEPRTDIFAVGAILYRAVTGHHAFQGPTVAATLMRATKEQPTPMREIEPTVPPRLEEIVLRCLEKKPEDRYPTVQELDDDLAALLEELEAEHVPPPLSRLSQGLDRVGPIVVGPPSLREVDALGRPSFGGTATSHFRDDSDADAPPGDEAGADAAIPRTIEDMTTGLVATVQRRRSPLIARRAWWPSVVALLLFAVGAFGAYRLQGRTRAAPPLPEAAPVSVPDDEAANLDEDEPGEETTGPLVDDPAPADEDAKMIIILEEDAQVSDFRDESDPDANADANEKSPAPRSTRSSPNRRPGADDEAEDERPLPAGVVMVGNYVAMLDRGPRTDQGGARRYCRALATAQTHGIDGWKLANPTVAGKVAGQASDRRLKRGRYWTSARHKGRARVVEVPTQKTASMKVERKFRPLCVARWP